MSATTYMVAPVGAVTWVPMGYDNAQVACQMSETTYTVACIGALVGDPHEVRQYVKGAPDERDDLHGRLHWGFGWGFLWGTTAREGRAR